MSENGGGETRVGMGKTLAYSSGQFGGNIVNMMFTGWVAFFYTDNLGGVSPLVSAQIMGLAMLIGRIVDGISDPVIGFWSDSTRTRLGRRRPFILIASPFLVLTFVMMFYPMFPRGSTALAVYAVAIMSLFWFFFTAVMGPYLSLLPEIAISSESRVRVSTFMAIAMLLANAYSGMAGPRMIESWGYFNTACFSGVLAIVFLYVTVFTVKEKNLVEVKPAGEDAPADVEENISMMKAFSWTFRNRPFQIYIVASVFQYLGFAALTASLPFIATRLMGKSVGFVSMLYLVSIPGFVVSFLIINKLVKKMEKARLYKLCLFLLAVTLPSLFLVGRVNLGVSPALLGMIIMGLLSFPIAGNAVLPMTILADITDYDETLTGKRREAMYFGMQGFLQKLATALSVYMQLKLFDVFGYSMENYLGVSLLGPIAGMFGFIGFLVFLLYPLDEKTKMLKKVPDHGSKTAI